MIPQSIIGLINLAVIDEIQMTYKSIKNTLGRSFAPQVKMDLLQSELIEHGKVLKYYDNLPTDLKQYILTFYKTCLHPDIAHFGLSGKST
tara:strand:+ start:1084 stop:1353 length:270 start_codon:yes stop_codon:yes gene_type:complete